MNLAPLITPAALRPLLASGQVCLLDARTGPGARAAFEARHLAGAQFVDLERDLAAPAPDPAAGGRHPLPFPEQFARRLGEWGIEPASRVVVYDDKQGANAAARLWWLLRASGHAAVQVLDGGWQAALAAGLPVATGPEPATAPRPPYPATAWLLPTVDADHVQRVLRAGTGLVIDVREARRYRGEVEPIDVVAGHIPGALNVPFSENLDAAGQFLSPEALRAKYAPLVTGAGEVVVHCGSGVTACHTLLALAHAGLPLPSLYVGSWSEWSRSGRPLATGAA
ncbi:sulfurtransferase [Hymenobacter sp. 15J16-1T3B]|uniref:sulfurtransferase n=1 Tax=Hymenobacter sp. 15J16-1T3B TaxID=2886941 RepID=UPI001D11CEDF|nr:sulfurtransferase [Hymenobacter sp. 15J16-1T3B]MCC3160315.1 sulfurtransferase [Hymenobacter sp. 15J16-1T3B]